MDTDNKLRIIFDEYVRTVFEIEEHIRFWKYFMNSSIKRYEDENPNKDWISQSGFGIYNVEPDGKMWLHVSKLVREINDLSDNHREFFVWIMNLALVRAYNAVELLLLRLIQHEYFPSLEDPLHGRSQTNKVIYSIKQALESRGKKVVSKNNRHVISFLEHRSIAFSTFLTLNVNPVNWKTNWKMFFELISILRNVVAHHEMMVTESARNDLNLTGRDMIEHYFEPFSNTREAQLMKFKDEQYFLNFLSHMNDFAGNAIKFTADKKTLEIIGLYPA